MERLYYSYNDFIKDLKVLSQKIDFKFDSILAVSRGGMTIGHFLGEYFDIRDVYCVNSIGYDGIKQLESVEIFNLPNFKRAKNILIVDDIVDSGKTMKELIKNLKGLDLNIKTASIFYKESAKFKPDFFVKYADCWIDFFWSEDLKNDTNDR